MLPNQFCNLELQNIMSLEIKIPNVAESITEVTLGKWLKKTGDHVKKDEAICEIETDKASQELFSEGEGILETLVEEGETIAVGATIAKINSNGTATLPKTENKTDTEAVKKEEQKNEKPAVEQKPISSGKVIEMLVTQFAESITEVVIGTWLKKDGDFVKQDEGLCEVETDKATQELPAEASGILRIVAETGTTLQIGELICKIEVSDNAPANTDTNSPKTKTVKPTNQKQENTYASGHPSPAANKILNEKGIETKDVKGTGIDGRITKEDALNAQKTEKAVVSETKPATQKTEPEVQIKAVEGSREQRRTRMSQMRKTISRRLVAVKNETAMLTTFNEVNMKPIMDMRKKYKEEFQGKHNVGLGFMSFFTKACALALTKFPEVNAMIDGTDIVYNDFVDISVAVSAPKGLVVPVLRNVEKMSFADIEKGILALAGKAKENTLSIEDMQGGTFTITNGGIFGSMMSTPIINAPQSAILGMHNIVERPMAVGGQVVILPMMYVALSYDHRIIDGREAVGFLVTVKKYLEEPERILFEL